MIEQDRRLLVRLAQIHTRLGAATLELLKHQDGGELPADGIRVLGRYLAELGGDLLSRADELEGHHPVDRVVIDGSPINPQA